MNVDDVRRAWRARPGSGRRLAELEARVDELEAEIRECRRHQLRLAELTDVVQELLLPVSQRNQAAVDEVLARYSEQLG